MSLHNVWTLEPVLNLDENQEDAPDLESACLRLKQALARNAVLPAARARQYPRTRHQDNLPRQNRG